MALLTTEQDINILDDQLRKVTKRLSMETGTVTRIACQYLRNWGIAVDEHNRGWLEKRSDSSYFNEWKSTNKAIDEAIERAIVEAELLGNTHLNTRLADMVVKIMTALNEENPFSEENRFRIGDIGAGTGLTTKAILDRMILEGVEHLVPFCDFFLLEPSPKRLFGSKDEDGKEDETYNQGDEGAYTRLRDHGIGLMQENVSFVCSHLQKHFSSFVGNESFDMIVASAVFHHFSFPTYLSLIREKLKKDGVLVMGDWFTDVWRHPLYTAAILSDMGADTRTVNDFRRFFELGNMTYRDIEKELDFPPERRRANEQMFNFLKKLDIEMRNIKVKERLRIFEGHESEEDRLKKAEESHFVTDYKELVKRPGFSRLKSNIVQVLPGTSICKVISLAKKRRVKKPEKLAKQPAA
jgi:hypothetical protein